MYKINCDRCLCAFHQSVKQLVFKCACLGTLHWRQPLKSMAQHRSVPEFHPSNEDWVSYTKHVQHYFIANDVMVEEKKCSILLFQWWGNDLQAYPEFSRCRQTQSNLSQGPGKARAGVLRTGTICYCSEV